jgi:PAS domain S-box-containing protein
MSDKQKDLLSGLTQLGLTQYESKVYSTLVTSGTCTAKDISNICGIPYGKTYEVINSLVNRGFAVVLPVKPMKYKPVDCEETLRILQSNLSRELEHAKTVFSSLKEKQKEIEVREPRGSFWVLHGRSAINNKIEGLIRKARKSIMLFLSGNAIHRMMYFKELLEQKRKDGVDISVITTKHSDEGVCSMWNCSFCDDQNMNTKSNFMSVDGEESIIFESVPDDKDYTTGTDVGMSILEKSTTSFLEAMFSVFNTYRHLLMSSANAIFILDAETLEVIEANSKCNRLVGLDRGALVGKNVKDIAKQLGMILQSSFDLYLRTLKKEKSINIKNFEMDIGSNAITVDVSAHIQKFYGKDAIIITVTDITHEKQIEREKTTIFEQYNRLFNTLPLPAILLSKNDKVLMANKAIEDMFGFKLSDQKDVSIYKAMLKEKQGAMKQLRRVSLKRDTVVKLPLITTKGIKEFIIFASKADSKGNKIVICKDISEFQDLKRDRKEVKKELKDSENKYKTLFESSSDAIMTIAPPKWNFTNGNPATIKMFKAKSEMEFNSKGPWELSPKYQPDGQLSSVKAKKMIMKAMRTGSNFFDWTHKRINGEDFPATVLLTRMKLGGKKMLQATVRDTTKLNKTTHALQESEYKYRMLFETMTQGVVYQSADGTIISANHAACDILGVSMDQMMGRSSKDPRWRSVHEDMSPFLGETHPAMVALKTGKEVCGVVMGVFHPNKKEYRWIIIEALPEVHPGEKKPYQVYTTFTDITQRKNVEELLRGSEAKYKTIVESATDQIFMLDTKLRFISVNAAAASMSHHLPEELIGTSILDLFPKETAARFAKNNKEVIETGKSKFLEEKMVIAGKEFYNNTILNPVKDSKGNVVAVMGIVRNITKQKGLEKDCLESRTRYKRLFDNVRAGVFCSALKDGKILDVNDYTSKMFGYEKKEEVIGRYVTEFYANPDEREELIDKVKKEGFVIGYPITVKKKDGTEMHLNISLWHSPYDETLTGIFKEIDDNQS